MGKDVESIPRDEKTRKTTIMRQAIKIDKRVESMTNSPFVSAAKKAMSNVSGNQHRMGLMLFAPTHGTSSAQKRN
jgi:hypothetical protein